MGFWALLLGGILALMAYLANGAFPRPLCPEEEKQYLDRMLAGDEGARRTLIERNLRLVAHVAKRFDHSREDMDDLISIGTIGLIKAVNTFDQHKRTRLATYAARCIENEILMYLRATKKLKGELLLYEPMGSDKEGNEITLLEILGTAPDEVPHKVEMTLEEESLYEKVRELEPRERMVLMMRYGLGNGPEQTQREIARKMGISRSYVSRIEKKAVQKLFEKLSLEGYS